MTKEQAEITAIELLGKEVHAVVLDRIAFPPEFAFTIDGCVVARGETWEEALLHLKERRSPEPPQPS